MFLYVVYFFNASVDTVHITVSGPVIKPDIFINGFLSPKKTTKKHRHPEGVSSSLSSACTQSPSRPNLLN